MAPKSATLMKFIGTISLGLLTGVSYTLSTITVPTLFTLPSATSASLTFTNLTTRALTSQRIWASLSTVSFLLAYALSPRGARHPYLLWTAILAGSSDWLADYIPLPARTTSSVANKRHLQQQQLGKAKKESSKNSRGSRMEASYEVLGEEQDGGTTSASEEGDGVGDGEGVNGEEVRSVMEGFRVRQGVRLAFAGVGFAMSLVGLWGDGS